LSVNGQSAFGLEAGVKYSNRKCLRNRFLQKSFRTVNHGATLTTEAQSLFAA
jgi:hypothetical protein